jgi:hypothetical protein
MPMSRWSLVKASLRLMWMAVRGTRNSRRETYVSPRVPLPASRAKALTISFEEITLTESGYSLKLTSGGEALLSYPPPPTPPGIATTGSSPQTSSQSPQKLSGRCFWRPPRLR